MIDIRVLGPLEVSGADGAPIAMASETQRRLVSVLALRGDSMVRSASLESWLGLSPGALRTSISRLRRLLGAEMIETTPPGYTLRARVDTVEFERLVTRAPRLDDDAARAVLEKALALWRGEPLVEFASEPWAEAHLGRLREMHAAAVEDLVVLQLDAGESSTALAAIQSLIDQHPFRDRPRALLLRALAEAGRRTDALRSFQSYRDLLLDEIGTEPSVALVELDRAIASGDEQSPAWPPRTGHPAFTRTRRVVEPRDPRSGPALPTPLSSFVGRRDELMTVAAMVGGSRLVTLAGAGGCGKTRLALAVAAAETDRHPGGTWWAELGQLTSPSQVTEQVATAVGLAPGPGADLTAQLVHHLSSDQRSLLVLDNAEHLLVPVAELVADVLARCPAVHVLVTSRESFGITGEMVWRVPSLAAPAPGTSLATAEVLEFDAVQLFLERARAARPGFVVDAETVPHLISICTGMDGLPLALELAAARTRTLPIETVARGVGDAVRWQATGIHSPLARHATLHASIAWSVDLLAPAARAVLTRLAVFQSAFTFEGALAVGASEADVDEVASAVSALVDASLLQLDDASGRYRMLRTVQQFCILRAQGTTELDAARARHVRHLAHWCTEVGNGRRGIERGPFLAEMPDVVAAMDWARVDEPREVFRMCAGLASVRSALGHNGNVADTWTWLLSLDRDAAVAEGWAGEWAAAVAALMASATAQRIDVSGVVEEVTALLGADQARERGWVARGAAMGPAYQGHLAPILAHTEETVARGDEMEISIYGGFAAYMLALMGRLPESALQLDELGRLTRRHEATFCVDTVGNGYAGAVLGELTRGELRRAARRTADRIPEDPAFSMTAAAALAQVALATNDEATMQCAVDWSQAGTIPLLRYLPTFIELARALMDGAVEPAADLAERYWDEAAPVPVSRVHPLPILTAALLAAGRTRAATAATATAAGLVEAMDPAPLLQANVLASRAQLDLHAGCPDEALTHVPELLDVTTAHGFVPMAIDGLELAAMAYGEEPAVAAALWAAAAAERRRLGYHYAGWPAPPISAPVVEPTTALTLDGAVALARGERVQPT